MEGDVKLKFLKNKIKFSFKKDQNIKIFNSFLSNKFLKTSFDGNINFNPYFNFDVILNISDARYGKIFQNFKNIKLEDIFRVNKKINGKTRIFYKNKNLNKQYINDLDVLFLSKNGNIEIKKFNLKSNYGNVNIKGNYLNYDDYGKFNFNFIFNTDNLKKLLKKFRIRNVKNSNPLKIESSGYFILPAGKINFNKISINEKEDVSENNLIFYKENFNNLISKKSLESIFDFKILKKFLELLNN